MLHDRRQPLVETGLAKHGFPPRGCGFLYTPQYAVRREVRSPDFQKTASCKGTRVPTGSPGLPYNAVVARRAAFVVTDASADAQRGIGRSLQALVSGPGH